MLTLDVAISTYRPEGIKRVEKMLLPPKEGVRYIVSWQEHLDQPIPKSLNDREDVEIHRLDKKGLSNNRNNSISHCKSDLVLIADDDLIYEPDFSEKIIKSFEGNPATDLGIFEVKFSTPKKYPEEECRLSLPFPKYYYCSSVEIAFRRERIGTIRFWNKMGLGNTCLQCGEDELFLITALKKGLNCRFINKTIASHPSPTTGDKFTDGILRGQGFIIRKIYPISFILRLPLKAYRISKGKKGYFYKSLFQLSKGALLSNQYQIH